MSKHAKTDPDGKAKAKGARKGKANGRPDRPSENSTEREIPLASAPAAGVTSDQHSEQAASMTGAGQEPARPAGRTNVEQTITLTKSPKPRKDERVVIFGGQLNAVQFLRTAFGEAVPDTITVTGDFAEPKAAKVPREKETPEERKARLAAMPKLTLAEKVAKAEARAQALREKLAKKNAPAEPVPA